VVESVFLFDRRMNGSVQVLALDVEVIMAAYRVSGDGNLAVRSDLWGHVSMDEAYQIGLAALTALRPAATLNSVEGLYNAILRIEMVDIVLKPWKNSCRVRAQEAC